MPRRQARNQLPSISLLTLGWKVTPDLHPEFWLKDNPRPGDSTDSDHVSVSAADMACHTIIVAKSGSGKSYFLGRLLEEILIKTKANCLILDSNADFLKLHETARSTLWTSAKYNSISHSGILPAEASRTAFETKWRAVSKRILSNAFYGHEPYEEFKIWWPSVSADFLAEDLDPIETSELRQCHNFVKAIAELIERKRRFTHDYVNQIDEAERLLAVARGSETELERQLIEAYKAPILSQLDRRLPRLDRRPRGLARKQVDRQRLVLERRLDRAIRRAKQASHYVSDRISHFYFIRAHEYQASDILADEAPLTSFSTESPRATVVDLPSFTEADRLLAVHATISNLWTVARDLWSDAINEEEEAQDLRVPTFVVVDEAHNLIPARSSDRLYERLRNQFRTIAAEGRKLGLYLILVTQRPDKLDSFVTSECENKAIMHLDSKSLLLKVEKNLGLEGIQETERCLTFKPGRVLIAGQWSPRPQFLYAAARRTREGGKNLRAEFWATPSA